MTAEQIRARLKTESNRLQSQAALARKIGVSAQFLCEVIAGRRAPTGLILAFLGLEKSVRYGPLTKR